MNSKRVESTKKWRQKHKDIVRIHNRKHRNKKLYGIDENIFFKLINEINYKCPGCKTEFVNCEGACIDHNHKTNKVRGILCKRCNFAIGYALDNPKILLNLAKYLKKHEF